MNQVGCNPSVAVVIRQVANMVKIAHLVGCDDVVLMAVIRQVTNVVRKDGLPVEQG